MTEHDTGLIGASVPRPAARRLVAGRGRYTDDIQLPRMVHVAFVRSPHAHAGIAGIDADAALATPGVARVVTGAEIAAICAPWRGTADHLPSLHSPPVYPLALEAVLWQGQPVAAVLAESREAAEDGADRVAVDWRPRAAVADPMAALEPDAPVIHPELGTNLAFETTIGSGDVDAAIMAADTVIERELVFARHTGVPLEPRSIIAEFDPATRALTVHQSHQSPWQQQDVFARQLGLDEHKVRVVTPDIGGAFGIKLQVYDDEVAVAALAVLTGRPVKYVADRLESFLADSHSREQRVTARIAVSAAGDILALEADVVAGIGAVNGHRRNSVSEGMMTISLAGAPYRIANYRARLRAVFQNKGLIGMYRAVGQPIACAVTERMIDLAAEAIGHDPVEMRRRNYVGHDMYPHTTASGFRMTSLSFEACLDELVAMMDYRSLRDDQARLRATGIHRGIGIATFVEITAPGAIYYGPAGARISTQEGCTVRLEPSGKVRCVTSVTDQGQGTWTGIAQIVAHALGIGVDDVAVIAGDTAAVPHGGGAWASRGIATGGEAADRAARALRDNVLALAGAILQADPAALDLSGGAVSDRDGAPRMSLEELARIGHFRQDTLPPGFQPELAATRSYAPPATSTLVANGIQGSSVEVDFETGMVRLLGHWVVEDCGRVINPLLVDEQIRGGVVQGIGGALLEELRHDGAGQVLNGTLADYLVPMSGEMPDIEIGHVETRAEGTALGAKGAGEAGTVGAPGAVLAAVNDALGPLGARVDRLPMTPEAVLRAIAEARRGEPTKHGA